MDCSPHPSFHSLSQLNMAASEAHFEMLREKLLKFMDEHIYPNEQLFYQQSEEIRVSSNGFWTHPPIVVELKVQQKSLIVPLGLGLVSCFGLDLQATSFENS